MLAQKKNERPTPAESLSSSETKFKKRTPKVGTKNDLHSKLERHYCRNVSKKLYLEPIFPIKMQVYDFNAEIYNELNTTILSMKSFHTGFYLQNFSICRPREEQCYLCTSYDGLDR